MGVVASLVEARQSHPRLLVGRRCMLWRVRLQNPRRQPSGFRFWHGQRLSSLTGVNSLGIGCCMAGETVEPPVTELGIGRLMEGLNNLTSARSLGTESPLASGITEPPVGHAVGIDMSLDGGLSNPTGDVILGIEALVASGITELPCAPCVGVECATGRGAQ